MHETSEVLLLLVLCADSTQCLEGTKKWWQKVQNQKCEIFFNFQTDGYKSHLSTANAEKWEEYQNIKSAEDKEVFFSSEPVAFGNTFHAHLEPASHLKVFISAKIVEDVIVDLLFHQDDIESVTQKNAMALFKKS